MFSLENAIAFREIFRRFVCLFKEWDLVEGENVAIDSFKIRGSNSIKNNFNEAKLKRHIEYIDKQIRLFREYCFLIISDLMRFISLALKDYFPSNKDILVLCHLKLVVSNPLTNSKN